MTDQFLTFLNDRVEAAENNYQAAKDKDMPELEQFWFGRLTQLSTLRSAYKAMNGND